MTLHCLCVWQSFLRNKKGARRPMFDDRKQEQRHDEEWDKIGRAHV